MGRSGVISHFIWGLEGVKLKLSSQLNVELLLSPIAEIRQFTVISSRMRSHATKNNYGLISTKSVVMGI
jgi:hypothetical protein